jgi:hypothetical protein
MSEPMPSTLQGRDHILVDAGPEVLWRLIADSNELPNWGPPVIGVEILSGDGRDEGLGAVRKVHAQFGRRAGYFVEHRVEHVDGRKVAYLIDEDSFGLSRLLARPGFSLELDPSSTGGTRVTFSFFHDPRGLAGRALNPLIRLRQRCNRLVALKSLKRRAEDLATT